jgi:SPP1 gp7 family putative phage head morphogenesis protein
MDAGYDMYEFISSIDDRTCDECADLDGQVFYFSEAEEGVNFPPIHPNCRSNIIGYKG